MEITIERARQECAVSRNQSAGASELARPATLEATPDAFKLAFRGHAAGVAVVTADPGTGPVALTATSVFSVSADPPVLVFSLSALSSSTPAIRASESIVVHLLDEQDKDLAVLGSTSGVDRFADAESWSRLPTGEPYYRGVRTWIRARVTDLLAVGSSTLVVATAQEVADQGVEGGAEPGPLVYHNRAWHALGDHSRV
jgi:flavin reductase (DIM6/NTAB) family NADH-FMN oxidoreductase RutF